MYLFTKLSKRTKAISWFLLHVFVLQIIPFSSFANERNTRNDLNQFTVSGRAKKNDLIDRILAWSAPSLKEESESDAVQRTGDHSENSVSDKNSVQLKSVSASGGGFTPGSMNDMVDPFTGDFSYNIPLMDVEGYPLTLNYNGNVNMNSDASWVGLGWNLDVGSVNREMRGIPDEFNGDQSLTRTLKQLDDITSNGFKAGGYISLGLKKNYFTPKVQITGLWGSYENSYLGLGKTFDIGLQATVALSYSDERGNIAASFGLGYTSDSKGGVGFNRDYGFSAGYGPKSGSKGAGGSIGATFGKNFNSRHGLMAKTQSFSVSAGYTAEPYKSNSAGTKMFEKGDGTSGRSYEASYGASTTIMFGTAASTPRIQFNSTSLSNAFFLNAYVGAKTGNLIAKVGAIVETYESSSKMAGSNTINEPAYGYLHSGKRANATGGSPVMDFNRGTDFEFSERMKNLPFSVQTYDIFHASSSGLNGQFRANRTDVGTYYDASTQGKLNENSVMLVNDDIKAVNVGVLFGAGITIEVGYSTGVQKGEMISGKWGSPINFAQISQNTEFDPTSYFKAIGELTPNNLTNYTNLGGASTRRFNLTAGSDINVTSAMDNGVTPSVSTTALPVRATAFNPKTANAMFTGANVYDRTFRYYNSAGTYVSPQNRVGAHRTGNHISAVQITSTNGGIYTYGIPNYSLISSEVTFSCSGRPVDATTGQVSYSPTDDGTSNSLGKSQMYDRTDIPAYPSAFLLTSLVSEDYFDVTGDGPSIDDIGSYHKFDYVKSYDNYKWRFPISGYNSSSDPKAIVNKGFLSLDSDDIASYTYGEREVYYPKTIKGKNYVAVFVLEDRKDAFGVIDNKGFLDDTKPLKALDKIILYNLSDYETNGTNATPLQTVDFDYDYTLCLKAPSNKDTYSNPTSTNNGKLTLKKIMTYSGTSKEMGLSAMEFDYNAGPSYNHLNVDRWGNYKPNNTSIPNDLYPYAIQDEATANTYAAYWKLAKITTPGGAEMIITYESDSYGYVQNKRAMRQFEIAGMLDLYKYHSIINTNYWTTQSTDLRNEFRNDSYNPNPDFVVEQFRNKYGEFKKNLMPNNVIVFRLDKPISSSLSKTEANKKVKDDYFKDPSKGPNSYLQELYFNVYAEVKSGYQEMIPCFVKIAPDYPQLFQDWSGGMDNNMYSIGVLPPSSSTSDYQYGYVVLELINVGKIEETKKKEKKDKDILILHPIQRFGIDFIRQNLPDIVYGACRTCEGELAVDKKALFGNEMYEYIITKGNYLRNLTTGRSFVRLFEPDNKKMGGNTRVKSVQLNDKWVTMSTEESITDGTYGWSYQYPERDKTGGVAAYEPRQGMDENPFYEWDSYYDFAKKFPDELNFNVMPLAQQLYPSEVVGYEKVKVVMNGAAGSKGEVELNFHTNKEEKYKTVAGASDIDKSQKINEKSFFTGKTVDLYGFSQGYSVITNNFHGKPIDITLKDQQGNTISQTQYEYYEIGEKIPMIDRKGHVENENVAQEFDVHLDSRYIHDESKFKMAGLTVGFTWSIPPKISLAPFYTQNSRERGFYSLNLLKHINYSAVTKSIKTTNMASENISSNLLYDKYSGALILTSLGDEYDDRLYNLVYPAHWANPNLREVQTSYPGSNSGSLNSTTGLLTLTYDLSEFYAPGDLIELTNGSSTSNGYILSISPGASGSSTAYIVNTTGEIFNAFSGVVNFHIKTPNRKNRLIEAMQSIVTKKPLSVTSGTTFSFPTDNASEEVIYSTAISYKDKDNIGECSPKLEGQYINLFANGTKGDPVIETSFSWQSERKNELHTHKTRFDGAYLDFKPFYALNSYGVWARIDKSNYPFSGNGSFQKWRKNGIVTRYDRYGSPIESRDLIGNYTALVTITNTKIGDIPIAEAANANATDIAFDGFEIYTYYPALYGTYFNFQIPNSNSLVSTVRHSGKTSLKLLASQTASYTSTTTDNCPFDRILSTDIPASYLEGRSCNCPPPLFNPNPGDYIFGAWVKQSGTGATVKVIVGSGGSATTYTAVKTGPVIEGWQRVEGTCTIPAAPIQVSLKLENGSSTDAYFDDFRLHPFLAQMSTVVYDPLTLLPMASHDENNYSTFFNYDENLQLVRIKVETIEGIKTISETEFGLHTK